MLRILQYGILYLGSSHDQNLDKMPFLKSVALRNEVHITILPGSIEVNLANRPNYHALSRRISVAAFLPQAPITPPPGWLAAPHRYSPGTGVR